MMEPSGPIQATVSFLVFIHSQQVWSLRSCRIRVSAPGSAHLGSGYAPWGVSRRVPCTRADDYITKPFSPNELAARVKAALRRSEMSSEVTEPTVEVGKLFIDFGSNRVLLDQSEVFLSYTEYRLLSYLARNAGRILTRDQILERIWGEEYVGEDHVGEDHLLHVTIGRLRLKLEDQTRRPKYILTRRGIGYSFPTTEESSALAAVGVG